jgi:DNA-binding CsgD family transcriptional regulator
MAMRSKGRACDDVRDYHPALKQWGVTPREAEVARLVGVGYENREISGELDIAVSTVKVHVGRLVAKLDTGSRSALIGEIQRILREYREEQARAQRAKLGRRRGLRVAAGRRAGSAAGDGAGPAQPGA